MYTPWSCAMAVPRGCSSSGKLASGVATPAGSPSVRDASALPASAMSAAIVQGSRDGE